MKQGVNLKSLAYFTMKQGDKNVVNRSLKK